MNSPHDEWLQREQLRMRVMQCGFDDVRFAAATQLIEESTRYEEWIQQGFHGSMQYLERNIDKRKDVTLVQPQAQTVIVVAKTYYTPHTHNNTPAHTPNGGNSGKAEDHHADATTADNVIRSEYGKISRYAWGDDYHELITKQLDSSIEQLQKDYPQHSFRRYTDTGPVMEKAWAVRSGIGWQGKNSNILSRSLGSYFFLGVIITTLKVEPDAPVQDHCGTCTACIDACPTHAIVQPSVVDATRCISYWTIETKGQGEMPPEVQQNLDGWLYGCDVCQEVCPWNRFAVTTSEPAFQPRLQQTSLNPDAVLTMSEEDFRNRFKGSPIKRTKLRGLQRNARELRSYYQQHRQ
jgi:epoxyqueuosine reductase